MCQLVERRVFGQHHDFIVHQDLRIAARDDQLTVPRDGNDHRILGDDKLSQRFPRMGRYPRRREYSSVRQFRKQDLIIHMQRRLGVGKFHRAVGAQHAEYHHARPGRLYGRKRTVPLMLRGRYS